jgi:hypothetical protein
VLEVPLRQRALARRLEELTLSAAVQEGKSLRRLAARPAAEIKMDFLRCPPSAHCREMLAALATALPVVEVAAQVPTGATLLLSRAGPVALDVQSMGQRMVAVAAAAAARPAPQEGRAALAAAAAGRTATHPQPWPVRKTQAQVEEAAAALPARRQPALLAALVLSC